MKQHLLITIILVAAGSVPAQTNQLPVEDFQPSALNQPGKPYPQVNFERRVRARLAAMLAQAIAPTGAMFTFLALWTGALWGKPTWGTWWVWDARLTSELILLFLYLGVMLLHASIDDLRRADRASALFALVGVVNVPIIYFSVRWWNTLHQGASVSMTAAPKMAATMLTAMLLMAIGFWLYSMAVILMRLRCVILERNRQPRWSQGAVEPGVKEVRA